MTNKARVANLLVANPKTWINTEDIAAVGGLSATRRLRELRTDGWNIKTRKTDNKYQYQLTRLPAKAKIAQYA